jgi:hypothetical protein
MEAAVVLFLLSLSALAADLVQVSYDLEAKPGDAVFVADAGTVVRAAPNDSSDEVGRLAFGAQALVKGASEAGWVSVGSGGVEGFVPTHAVTPGLLMHDLDGDGTPEPLLVRYARDHSIEVLRLAAGKRHALKLAAQRDIDGFQDRLSVRALGHHELPLLEVTVLNSEMCGSGDHVSYVSWAGDSMHLAGTGHTWGDAPFFSSATWDIDGHSKTAVKTERQGSADDGSYRVEVTLLRFEDGVFVAQDGRTLELAGDVTEGL